jgi:hypothetical protein
VSGVAVRGGMAEPAEPAEEQSSVASTIFRSLIIYFIFSSFMNKQASQGADNSGGDPHQAQQQLKGQDGAVAGTGAGADVVVMGEDARLPPYTNLMRLGQEVNLWVYLSVSESDYSEEDLVWSEKSIYYDWEEVNSRAKNITLPLTGQWEQAQHNTSIYAHVYFTLPQIRPGMERADSSNELRMVHGVQQLNRYAERPKLKTSKNLLGYTDADDPGASEAEAQPDESAVAVSSSAGPDIISLWKPKLTLNLVVDHTVYPRNQVPAQVATKMNFDRQKGKYHPKLFFNDFWTLRESQFPLNETVEEVTLEMEYYPLSLMKWQLIEQMEENWKSQREMGTGGGDAETEVLKNMLIETSPALLVTTGVVSCLHMVFDMLAFKNDIKFWRNQKSLEGLSVGTVFINSFCSVVVFLYLMNSEEISNMILFSQGLSLCIEFWKIKKVVLVSLDWDRAILGILPRPTYKHRRSYQTVTAKYDRIAMRYMSFVLYPAVVGYSIYSLRYEAHKGWYTWVLGSLVGAVYTFGFIMMTPQLYINYKLKSVAHMPWRVMVYKSLNTFIDDLFAFIIKMPLLHRLSCFRDDIIFFIFLYQRYIYDIDETRLNEFGVSKEMYAEADAANASGSGEGSAEQALADGDTEAKAKAISVAAAKQRKQPAADDEWTKMGDNDGGDD